jgi:hypothetical protein
VHCLSVEHNRGYRIIYVRCQPAGEVTHRTQTPCPRAKRPSAILAKTGSITISSTLQPLASTVQGSVNSKAGNNPSTETCDLDKPLLDGSDAGLSS